MATVGFDTATEDTSVAAVEGATVVHEALLGLSEKGSPQHATALLAEVERAVAAAGGWEEIETIAVGLGPGSFTGVRVGIATARALGFSRGIPVVGVCTLDAIGAALVARGGADNHLAVLDARRGEVFTALYSAAGRRLREPAVEAPEQLAGWAADLGATVRAGGSGAVRFRQELASASVDIADDGDPVHRVAAPQICFLAASEGGGDSAGSVAPIYLRAPDAERWRERNTVQTTE